MEDNPIEDDDIDFSMISPANEKHKQFDSSVNDLLQNPKNQQLLKQIKTQPSCPDNSIKQQPKPQGSFMRDLQKMQHQISYQTNPYDIYERSQHVGQFTGTVEAKQQDTCTKTTNNMTNMTKIGQKNLQNDFKHLIVDFSEERFSKIKNKECFQDYFETQILKTKKIDQRNDKQYSHRNLIYLPVKIKKNKQVCVGGESKMKQTKSNSLKNSESVKLLRKVKQGNSPGLKKYSYKSPIGKSSSKSKSISRSGQSTSRSTLNKKISNKKMESKQMKKKKKQMISNPLKSQVYSEYFGFPHQNQIHKKKKIHSSHSKGKKIIFSKKNVNVIH